LGSELSDSYRHNTRSPFSLDPLRTALNGDPSARGRASDEFAHHQYRSNSWNDPHSRASSRTSNHSDHHHIPAMHRSSSAASQLPTYSPELAGQERLPPASSLMRRSSMATSQSHHPSAVNDHRRPPYDSSYHHKPTLVSNVDWGGHRRKDSSDSTWSSYSSSSSASSHALPSPGSSTLQFQPLPHAHVNASRPHKNSNSLYSSNTVSPDLHSPYGVLISDADQPGSLSADPQRLAILRTLKADGPHGTFSLEDPRAASSSRYECSYCQKRFNRPSSLRIHINSHTGNKPFECTFTGCGRRFSVQSNMRRHARVHQQGRKVSESSGDEMGEGDSSRSQTPPSSSHSSSHSSRPELGRLDVDDLMSMSDSDSDDSNLRTAHPISNSRRGLPSPRSNRGEVFRSGRNASG